ncbi:protein UBASH3A homolog [Sabethes cyaneus]|uniref:protein UBASH3A homolog n=1 Tax=Sabethes cyaneus TaxID=53552 RepID=UPI00237D7B53|nr:protein UBASH3A homolog [Sabethes cyaneus]
MNFVQQKLQFVRLVKPLRLVIMQQSSKASSSSGSSSEKQSGHAHYKPIHRGLEMASPVAKPEAEQTGRRVYVVRHAERIDMTFGNWIPDSFDDAGTYVRKDLNMPQSLPSRKPSLWELDSPLTNLGCYQASLTGDAMKEAGVRIDHVFSSPSFRCIQTASSILESLGMRESHPIRIEPGLFEWIGWYPNGLPNWISSDELKAAGHNIASNYTPITSKEDLIQHQNEDLEGYYRRNAVLAKKIVENNEGNLLLVGHAATLDTCTRPLVSSEKAPIGQLIPKLLKITYCSMAMMESTDGGWKLAKPPCPPFTNTKNDRFDWNYLL